MVVNHAISRRTQSPATGRILVLVVVAPFRDIGRIGDIGVSKSHPGIPSQGIRVGKTVRTTVEIRIPIGIAMPAAFRFQIQVLEIGNAFATQHHYLHRNRLHGIPFITDIQRISGIAFSQDFQNSLAPHRIAGSIYPAISVFRHAAADGSRQSQFRTPFHNRIGWQSAQLQFKRLPAEIVHVQAVGAGKFQICHPSLVAQVEIPPSVRSRHGQFPAIGELQHRFGLAPVKETGQIQACIGIGNLDAGIAQSQSPMRTGRRVRSTGIGIHHLESGKPGRTVFKLFRNPHRHVFKGRNRRGQEIGLEAVRDNQAAANLVEILHHKIGLIPSLGLQALKTAYRFLVPADFRHHSLRHH